MALLDETLSDSLSINADAIALAMNYQYNLTDLVVLADSMFVETSFNTDTLNISDSVSVSKAWGVTLADTVSTSDSVAKGFLRWATLLDSPVVTDQTNIAAVYAKVSTDTVGVGDTIHTWMASNSILTATLEGSADLRAVLIKKKAADIPVGAPPRVVMLPKQAPPHVEHNIVNPNPPRNREG